MIPPKDLIVDAVHTLYPGCQHVGVMPKDVRVHHIPSGISVRCGTARSQYRNRQIAIQMIEWGLMLAEENP